MKRRRPTEPVRLLVSDEAGRIFDHPDLFAAGVRGAGAERVPPEEWIPLPRGSDLFTLPGRRPVGINPVTGEPEAVAAWGESAARAVATFLSPAHTSSHHPAWEVEPEAPTLPTYAYAVVGFADERYWTSAVRVDADDRQEPWRFQPEAVQAGVLAARKVLPENRVREQLERCALDYQCRAAQNFFLSRHEAPLPVSIACNAQCVGCISLQPDGTFRASHERLDDAPRPEHVAALALHHLAAEPSGVVSFGQGCEGEPLLLGDVIVEATRLIRSATRGGTINLNSNASKPDVVRSLCEAGLDSLRASMNSPRPDVYAAYYQPRGYTIAQVVESLRLVHEAGRHTAINLLCFPGVTDTEPERDALLQLIDETGLDMIQMRNLNIDPDLYARVLPAGTVRRGRGMRWLMAELRRRHPALAFGYFNPYLAKRKSA